MEADGKTETNGIEPELRLRDFDLSEVTGFVSPDPPLARLPADCFARWEDLVSDLPALIKERRIREEIHRLPPTDFTEDSLKSEQEWQRAYSILTFLSQAYLWVDGEAGLPEKIPRVLAVPWCSVSDRVGLPPVGTYAAVAVFNYALRDPRGRLECDNMYTPLTFTGTEDESWFYVIPLQVELDGAPALTAMISASSAVRSRDNDALRRCLATVARCLEKGRATLERMKERCDPKVSFTQLRPFQAGSKGLDAFPSGLTYEGVDPEQRQYHGASAGQAPTIHAFDVFFRAEHRGDDGAFMREMWKYMPPKHRAFLAALAEQPSVREYVVGEDDAELTRCFDAAVKAFADFRSYHIQLVARYIVSQRGSSRNASLDNRGTGGTNFMKFLKNVRDNTSALKIGT